MLQFFKMLKPKTRWKFAGLIVFLIGMTVLATFLVVHFSDLFSLGTPWGLVLTLIIWSWFTVLVNTFFRPSITKFLMRWMEEDMNDLFTGD